MHVGGWRLNIAPELNASEGSLDARSIAVDVVFDAVARLRAGGGSCPGVGAGGRTSNELWDQVFGAGDDKGVAIRTGGVEVLREALVGSPRDGRH